MMRFKMEVERAIKTLEHIRRIGNGESEYKNDAQAIALDMAIEALQERKTGKWVRQGGIHNMYTSYACSECGREIEMYYDFGNIPTDADVINEFPYCHCGARMEVDE